jgi:hypothetical protein
MSEPGGEFLDLLSATVALGAFRSVVAEVVALAEEAANLSDEQLRVALMALDHATHRLVGGEAVSVPGCAPPGMTACTGRWAACRLVFSESAAVRCCPRSLSPSVTAPTGRRCVPPHARSAPLVVARVPAGRRLLPRPYSRRPAGFFLYRERSQCPRRDPGPHRKR